jgi:hypothetical protein
MSNPDFSNASPNSQELNLQLSKQQLFILITALKFLNQHIDELASDFTYPDTSNLSATAIKDLCQEIDSKIKTHIGKVKESIAYVTREFVRRDCGVNGVILSDEDCDAVIAEVTKLAIEGKFKHTGVYWIANDLTARGKILKSNRG